MSLRDPIFDRDLAILFDISGDYNEGGLDSYVQNILACCERWFAASGTSVFLKEHGSDDYVLFAKLGADSTVPDGAKLRAGEGIAGACIASGEPVIVQGFADSFPSPNPRPGIGSAMVIPLVTHESGCVGVMNLSRRLGEPSFTGADLFQAGSLANHVGLAVSNVRLYAQMNEAIAERRSAYDKLDAVIACLGIGVVVVNAFRQIERWNPEAERLLETSLTNYIGVPSALSACSESLRQSILKSLKRALLGKKTTDRAFEEVSDRAWSVVASPIPGGGATVAIQDVSSHEQVLRELSRAKRLAEIGQMTAAIAHEIRNPLTGIRSAAQIVQGAPGEAAEFGRIIEREALKLNSLCDEFLEFARPLNLRIERVDLVDLISRISAEYSNDLEKHSISLRLFLDACSPKIKADAHKVEQVVRNLLLNALQASRAGGVVTISLNRERLVIEDQGHGIEADVVEKLFTPFFTTKASGTGLGLSNVRKVVDAHGWQIRVDSTPGTGTRFEVLFRERQAA